MKILAVVITSLVVTLVVGLSISQRREQQAAPQDPLHWLLHCQTCQPTVGE